MFQGLLCQCIYSKHFNSHSKISPSINWSTTHYTVNSSGQLYADLYYFPEKKTPHIMTDKIGFDRNEIVLFIVEKKNQISMLKRLWSLNTRLRMKVFSWKGFLRSPFGIRDSGGSQHSMWNPLSQESQKSMLSWGGQGWGGREKEGKKKRLNIALLEAVHQLFAFVHVLIIKLLYTKTSQVTLNKSNLLHFCLGSYTHCKSCIQYTATSRPSHLLLTQDRISNMTDVLKNTKMLLRAWDLRLVRLIFKFSRI